MATYDVAGRSAIVTGAGSGIGRAVAIKLAANGAAVVVADLNQEAADAVAAAITEAGGTAVALVGDASDPQFTRQLSRRPRRSRRCASPSTTPASGVRRRALPTTRSRPGRRSST